MITPLTQTLKSFRKWFAIILSIYLFMVATHIFWLPWVAGILILDQNIKTTELLVASTGSYARFRFAVDLVKKKQANNLLLLGDRRIQTSVPGKSPLELAEEEAEELGIDPKILSIKHSTSTWVDALNTLETMKNNRIRSGAVISDIYNMRRLAMIYDHIFQGSGYDMQYIPVRVPWNSFHPDRWWQYPFEFEYVVKEWIKLPINYYRILLKK